MKKRAHYSASFKAQIVREILKEEKTIPQIATEHGIHPVVLQEIWKAHEEHTCPLADALRRPLQTDWQ